MYQEWAKVHFKKKTVRKGGHIQGRVDQTQL